MISVHSRVAVQCAPGAMVASLLLGPWSQLHPVTLSHASGHSVTLSRYGIEVPRYEDVWQPPTILGTIPSLVNKHQLEV